MGDDRDSLGVMASAPATTDASPDEVTERIAARRHDEDFQDKLRQSIEQHQGALERLAT